MRQAEQDTGISNQQVYRWHQGLANEDAYRRQITEAACRKAGIEPAENHRAGRVNAFLTVKRGHRACTLFAPG
jgi:hypothetical protein